MQPIVIYGTPVLRMRSHVVPQGAHLDALIATLLDTMRQAHGLGLAAPQIGEAQRVFVVSTAPIEKEKPFERIVINPSITMLSDDTEVFEEGCLSIPSIREKVERPKRLRLQYFDETWKARSEELEGLEARVVQHEYDHLNGVLFIDHLSAFKRRLLKRKLRKVSQGDFDVSYATKLQKKT